MLQSTIQHVQFSPDQPQIAIARNNKVIIGAGKIRLLEFGVAVDIRVEVAFKVYVKEIRAQAMILWFIICSSKKEKKGSPRLTLDASGRTQHKSVNRWVNVS